MSLQQPLLCRRDPSDSTEPAFSNNRRATVGSRSLLFLIALWVLSFATQSAYAVVGSEYQASQEDLNVVVDSRWAGCTNGGYYPIRVRVTNRAEARDLRIAFEPTRKGLPHVSKTISVPQNASVVTTLLVPLVAGENNGELNFYVRGGRLKDLARNFSLSEMDYRIGRPALIVITNENVDCSAFEKMVTSILAPPAGGHWGGVSSPDNHAVLPSTLMPQTSLAYSGVDIVAIPRAGLEQLRAEQRDALLQWAQTGGVLLVYNVGDDPATNADFAKLTGLSRAAARVEWVRPQTETPSPINLIEVDQHGSQTTRSESNPQYLWKDGKSAFAAKRLGMGFIVGFADTPFPGTPHEWAWLVRSVGLDGQIRFSNRHGLNARTENLDFFRFLIPGIQSVPAYSFVAFITIFAFIIGPLNYYLLLKRNKLNYLIITVPALAFITSICLFLYSAVAHGFSVKARVRSLTFLDQGLQTAITTTRLSMYAGLAPSSGLKFSPETAVYPIWPTGQEFESGSIDWSDTQHLSSGWLRSRTKTQFVTVAPRAERGRLNFEPPQGETMKVTNGLEWSLSVLAANDEQGNWYFGENISAGAPATLRRMGAAESSQLLTELKRSYPEDPDSLANSATSMFGTWSNRRYRPGYWGGHDTFSLSSGGMERMLSPMLHSLSTRTPLTFAPRSYIAVTTTAPNIEFGTDVEVVEGWHVILGDY